MNDLKPLTPEDFPCRINVCGKRFIPVSVIDSNIRFRNFDDAFSVFEFCKNTFDKNQYRPFKLADYQLFSYGFYRGIKNPTAHHRHRMLAEECIPALVEKLNQKNAYLIEPIECENRDDEIFNCSFIFDQPRKMRRTHKGPHNCLTVDEKRSILESRSKDELIDMIIQGKSML